VTTSGFVETNGGRLYFETGGVGPGLVLVHAGVANLRMWDRHVPTWSTRFTVLRYDTRGFGRTESEHVAFSNRADLVAVMDEVGLERACLVGVSRGGQIVLDTALEHPDRVSGLVVAAGGVSGFTPSSDLGTPEMWDEAEKHWVAHDFEWLADALSDRPTRIERCRRVLMNQGHSLAEAPKIRGGDLSEIGSVESNDATTGPDNTERGPAESCLP